MVKKAKTKTRRISVKDSGLVQVLTVSAIDNTNGRSVATVTLQTVDGKQHTFKTGLDDEGKHQLRLIVSRLMEGEVTLPGLKANWLLIPYKFHDINRFIKPGK